MSATIKATAKGGHLVHLKVSGVNKALCGHQAKPRGAIRAGWWQVADSVEVTCKKCLKKAST